MSIGGLYVQKEQSSGSRRCEGIRSYLFSARAAVAAGYQNAE
jgi:hypothetical protein